MLPGLLYLGGWDAAEDLQRLDELNIRRWASLAQQTARVAAGWCCQELSSTYSGNMP